MRHEYVNVKQIANRLNVSPVTIYGWRNKETCHYTPFPPPVSALSASAACLLWDWTIVESWSERNLQNAIDY